MANSFNKEEVILFEQVLAMFDTDNTVANQCAKFSQPGNEMQRRGDTVWRPVPQISTIVEGLDVSSSYGSITGMSVPATLSTISNVPFQMDALELRDPLQRDRKARSAAQALSAALNRQVANVCAIWGSQTVAVTGALSGYDDVSLVEALLMENDVSGVERTMVIGARDYNVMGGNLADRTLMPRSERAYETTNIGPVAGFNTYKTGFAPAVAANGATVTVSGAGQKHVPASTTTAATGEEQNVDNRTMNLDVNTTTGVVAGDKFTIAGVNAVSLINKQDTAQLKTFTVVEVVDGTTLKIAPPIIVSGATDAETDYANCSASPANLAALTFLNNTATKANVHFCNDAVEVFGGRLAFDEDMAGVSVMRETTDSGIEIIFAKQGNVGTGVASFRLTMFHGSTCLVPEMAGILIGGQT